MAILKYDYTNIPEQDPDFDYPDTTWRVSIDFNEMGVGSTAHIGYMVVDGVKTCFPSMNPKYGQLDEGRMIIFGTGASIFVLDVIEGEFTKEGIKFTAKTHVDSYHESEGCDYLILDRYLSKDSRLWRDAGKETTAKNGFHYLGETSRRSWEDISNGVSDLKMDCDHPVHLVSRELPPQVDKYTTALVDFEPEDFVTIPYMDIRQTPQSSDKLFGEIGISDWHYKFIKPIIDDGYETRILEDDTMRCDVSPLDLLVMNPMERHCHENGKVFVSWTAEAFGIEL